jgi:hypothetical protein
VESSIGHVRDLPAKGLSVDVDNDFKVDYEVHASKKATIAELKKALKDADELYLATDEDREGEAISWHLLEVLKPKVPVKRMVFHEISHPARHRRQPGRRLWPRTPRRAAIVDRLYSCQAKVLAQIRQGLSAGRVRSPAFAVVGRSERDGQAASYGTSAPRPAERYASPHRPTASPAALRLAGGRGGTTSPSSASRAHRSGHSGRPTRGHQRRPAVHLVPSRRSHLDLAAGRRVPAADEQPAGDVDGASTGRPSAYMTDSTTLSDTAIGRPGR